MFHEKYSIYIHSSLNITCRHVESKDNDNQWNFKSESDVDAYCCIGESFP